MTGDYSGRRFRAVSLQPPPRTQTSITRPTPSSTRTKHHDTTTTPTTTPTSLPQKSRLSTTEHRGIAHSVPVHKVLTVNRHDAGGCLTSKGHQLPQRWPARDAVVGVEALATGAVRIPWVTRCTERVAVVPAQVVQHRATCAT